MNRMKHTTRISVASRARVIVIRTGTIGALLPLNTENSESRSAIPELSLKAACLASFKVWTSSERLQNPI